MENSYSVASSESASHLRYTMSQTVVRFLVNFVGEICSNLVTTRWSCCEISGWLL